MPKVKPKAKGKGPRPKLPPLSDAQKKEIGRLHGCVPEDDPPAAPPPPPAIAGVLPLTDLRPSPTNPRRSFPDDSIRELADSVRAVGLLQPLVVRPVPVPGHPAPRRDDQSGEWVGVESFEVVAGERRLRAARLAGLDRVPVSVRMLDDDQVLAVQLVENDAREDVLPSEQAAAYGRLAAAGKTAEQVAAAVGKPVSFVRGVLRLSRLPAFALDAVDKGLLPRATAELVARVPGAESRKRAAGCVLLGIDHPPGFDDEDLEYLESGGSPVEYKFNPRNEVLSYRDAKELIADHFTRQLKDAPFDRRSLDLLPEAGSCDACPDRAGNNPEALADGSRPDMCLNPECFARKIDAHKEAETAKAAGKGVLPVEDCPAFAQCPPGYCDLGVGVRRTELGRDFPVYPAHPRRDEKLAKVLGKACPQKYIAFDNAARPHTLVKTGEARKVLQEAGVIARPEPRKKAKKGGGPAPDRADPAPKPPTKPAGPSDRDVDERAGLLGAVACRDALLGVAGSLDSHAASRALGFVARVIARDWADVGDERLAVLEAYAPVRRGASGRQDLGPVLAAVAALPPAGLVGFLLAAAAHAFLLDPRRDDAFRDELMIYADTTWEACREKARAELTADPVPAPAPGEGAVTP